MKAFLSETADREARRCDIRRSSSLRFQLCFPHNFGALFFFAPTKTALPVLFVAYGSAVHRQRRGRKTRGRFTALLSFSLSLSPFLSLSLPSLQPPLRFYQFRFRVTLLSFRRCGGRLLPHHSRLRIGMQHRHVRDVHLLLCTTHTHSLTHTSSMTSSCRRELDNPPKTSNSRSPSHSHRFPTSAIFFFLFSFCFPPFAPLPPPPLPLHSAYNPCARRLFVG